MGWIFGTCCSCCGLLVLVLAVYLIYASTLPTKFRVERSAEMNAPAEAIFPLLNDFHQWAVWSPWEKMDPNLKRTFSGPDSGVGATYQWAGNKKVGEGRMTIVESRPPEWLNVRLEFLKPWKATNAAMFRLEPSGAGTKVTWSMDGERNFMMKAMSVFMNMDKMIGKDFEAGLAAMKVKVEENASA
jgi:hypothetical protein